MNKWQKKIDRLSLYYDRTWNQVVEYHQQLGSPMPCSRAFRWMGYEDGAKRMHREILHLIRSNKYKVDKILRETKANDSRRDFYWMRSKVYAHLIKELTR